MEIQMEKRMRRHSSARRSASTEPSTQHEHDDLDTTAVSEMNSEEAVGEVLLTGTDG